MKYKVKSIIIGRMKKESEESDTRPCFVSLFDVNDPHKSGKVPMKILEFKPHRVIMKGLIVKYLPTGNDLVINDLSEIDIEVEKDSVIITGKQS